MPFASCSTQKEFFIMSAFLKSALGICVLSAAMFAGLGQSNEAQARPYGGYYGGYRGGYNAYYGPRYSPSRYNAYRYNSYRPYYGGYNSNYGRPYGYNSYYGPRNYIGVGPVRIGW
jgi:hypothetical protein